MGKNIGTVFEISKKKDHFVCSKQRSSDVRYDRKGEEDEGIFVFKKDYEIRLQGTRWF